MKQLKMNLLAVAAVSALLASSCTKNIEPSPLNEPTMVQVTAECSIENDLGTKVSYRDNETSYSFSWNTGDEILVQTSYNSTINKCTASSTGKRVPFTGTIASSSSTTLYGIWPYSESYKYYGSSGSIRPLILDKSSQSVAVGDDNYSNTVMVGYTEEASLNTTPATFFLTFKQVMSVVKFKVPAITGEKVTKVTLNLVGDNNFVVKQSINIESASYYSGIDSRKSVDVVVTGSTFGTEAIINMVLFPQDFTSKTMDVVLETVTTDGTVKNYTKNVAGINFLRNTIYPVNVDLSQFTPTNPSFTSLSTSETETANCYVVNNGGYYKFYAGQMGNGEVGLLGKTQTETGFHTASTAISPLSAKVLWSEPSSMVGNVSFDSGTKEVKFSCTNSKGNAVIAVYDNADPNAEGAKILWSWHIWSAPAISDESYVTKDNSPIPSTVKYFKSQTLTLMDINLGATAKYRYSITANDDISICGMLYQWGRKDPFPYNNDNITIVSQGATLTATIASGIENPDKFYGVSSAVSWWAEGSFSQSQLFGGYLWGNDGLSNNLPNNAYTAKKSIYDPCPPGYMVPPADTWTNFTDDGLNKYWNTSSTSWITSHFNVNGTTYNNGWYFYLGGWKSGSTTFYPGRGFRGNSGDLVYRDTGCYHSSLLGSGSNPYGLHIRYPADYVYGGLFDNSTAAGQSIRCVKATTITLTAPGS